MIHLILSLIELHLLTYIERFTFRALFLYLKAPLYLNLQFFSFSSTQFFYFLNPENLNAQFF